MKPRRRKKIIRLKKVRPGDSIIVNRMGDVTVQVGKGVLVRIEKGK